MVLNEKRLLLCTALLAFGLRGNLIAAPLKVLCINQAGAGAYYRANAVTALTKVLQDLAIEKGFTLFVPANAAATQAMMNDDSLSAYRVIVLNNNSSIGGIISDVSQRNAFQRWLKHGGGLVGWMGVMDHKDLWSWMTDSVFLTKFIVWSTWNSSAGRLAQVQVDTVPTNGIVSAQKPEYADLLASLPKSHWTWPDSWMSFSMNPRGRADVLLTIDEKTYDVPAYGIMGDHPIAWAHTLPPDSTGKQGRFIYNARGHESACFTGTGTGAAPNGIDTGETGLTRNWAWQSIRWAAGLTQPTAISSVKTNAYGLLDARNVNGVLKITVHAVGKQVVEVFDLSGHRLGRQSGEGDREYSFSNLKHNAVYLVRVKSNERAYVQRIAY